MNIGTISANKGEKAYGQFKTGETHGRFPVHIPLHIINGAQDGPTLVIQAGVSGLEIEPAMVLPQIVKALNPAELRGTLVVVPLMNTSGFEFEQINSIWDNKHMNTLGRGNANGSVSEQAIYQYYNTVIANADALIDIRTGAQWGYHHFSGVYTTGNTAASTALGAALGLQQVVVGEADTNSMAYEAASDGKTVVAAYLGGGPGLRDYRDEDEGRIRNAVLNALRHLGMLDGSIASETGSVTIIENPVVLKPTGERGLVFMDSSKRGQAVKAGDVLGIVRHPFTGETVEQITAPVDGVVVNAGASWPLPLEDQILGIVGTLKETVAVG
jgi:predicted deacylase